MLSWIKDIWSGFMMGVANIIPGVSGGTLLLVMGMYQRVISALSGLKASNTSQMLQHASGVLFSSKRKEHLQALGKQLSSLDLFFVTRLLIGAAGAILLLSGVMKYLLENQFSNTYAFFFGLIIISTLFSFKMLKSRKVIYFAHFILGAAATIAVTAAVDPSLDAKLKSDHYQQISQTNAVHQTADKGESMRFKYQGRYTARELGMAAVSGAVSISAMILPGISGSLVLILMGQYYEVISAVSSLKTLQLDYVVFLSILAIGMLVGLLLFSKLINFVFRRFFNGTMALLIGLMAGSLYALWPFKKAIVMDQYVRTSEGISLIKNAVIYTNVNILPHGTGPLLSALLFCAIGAGIMLLLSKYETKTE